MFSSPPGKLPYDLRIFYVHLSTTRVNQHALITSLVHLLGRILRFDQPPWSHACTSNLSMGGQRVSAKADGSLRRGDYQTRSCSKMTKLSPLISFFTRSPPPHRPSSTRLWIRSFPAQETIIERFIPPVANHDDFLRGWYCCLSITGVSAASNAMRH